jgi:ferric-dicitrate binding protein FerR (iron transport regulator)
MTSFDDDDRRDRALWRRYQSGAAARDEPVAPDANPIAAWLEGRADDDEREAVEAWFADAPGGAEELAALRELVDAPPVAGEAEARVRAPGHSPLKPVAAWLRGALPFWSWPQTAGAVAALVLACWLGFGLGEATYWGGARVTAAVAAELGFDLEDLAEDEFAAGEEDIQ